MGVTKAESEKVLRGSREGFTDSVKLNTALIRKRGAEHGAEGGGEMQDRRPV